MDHSPTIATDAGRTHGVSARLPGSRTMTVRDALLALGSAAALHFAFPLTSFWWLAPFALAGLTVAWCRFTPRRAALAGYASGLVFFVLGFSWFGETAGALVGWAAPVLDLGPAAAESLAFAFAAWIASQAARRCDVRLVPLAVAAAFALGEQLRSVTALGVPLEQLGLTMIDSPLRPLAAFAGGFGLTFATALLGASLGWWLLDRGDTRRARTAIALWLGVALCTALAWFAWPARHYATPTRRVAAVQGGIAQSVKRSDAGLALALKRYTTMTTALRGQHLSLVLWPETVITTDLLREPVLRARFARLADSLGATLYAGGFWDDGVRLENTLVIFDPRVNPSDLTALYVKEQLVPFAEYLPGPAWLTRLPYADQIGRFRPGTNAQESYNGATALICWESLFGDIAHARLRDDPSLFLIATDDAWFGTTEGPYEHAEAATLRAVETGRWVLRAGATGISGIVAPDGTWTHRTALNAMTTVIGEVGTPAPGPFARIGPAPFGFAFALLVVLPFALALLRPRPSTGSG
ncbi:MAG: apolipoprotein N-acyltransferase [Candidatus Eremiobacteraeota bacterium]|nr:apolipoprotein N-acyltransferase [Candidatus Eremiobacteraeota bacterium]